MVRQSPDHDFVTLLDRVARSAFHRASSEDVAEIAKQLWYGRGDVVAALSKEISTLQKDSQRKRALYLVDRLRRYPCVSRERAALLKRFVSSWSSLKPAIPSQSASQKMASHRLDKLAFEWGLEEDVTSQMKDALQYQTRHYAATQGVLTGYSDAVMAAVDWSAPSLG